MFVYTQNEKKLHTDGVFQSSEFRQKLFNLESTEF